MTKFINPDLAFNYTLILSERNKRVKQMDLQWEP